MKLAFLNPPWRKPGRYGVRAGSRWPHLEHEGARYMPFPMALAYAASLAESRGFEVRVFDGCATRETDDAYLERVRAFSPDLLVQENATASIAIDLAWSERLHGALGAPLLMTGHHFVHMADHLERYPFIDALAGGEWEASAVAWAERRRARASLVGVAGLVHREGPGGISREAPRPNFEDLDALPFPHRASLDMRLYHDNPGDLPAPGLQMIASRGCPYRCDFCVWPQVVYRDHRYRTRSVANVVDEIEHAFRRESTPYRSYYFDDDTFNIGEPRLLRLADELIRRGLEHIPWGAMCRADTWSAPTLEALRRSGLKAVKYGVESGDQKILDDSGKRLSLDRLRETMRVTHALGIRTHLTFSFGLIGESHETMRRTLELALELNPHTVQFSIATPFPGTRMHDHARKHRLLVTDDFAAFDGTHRAVVRTENLSAEELEAFLAEAYDTWDRHAARRGGLWRRAARQPSHALRWALSDPTRVVGLMREAIVGAAGRAL